MIIGWCFLVSVEMLWNKRKIGLEICMWWAFHQAARIGLQSVIWAVWEFNIVRHFIFWMSTSWVVSDQCALTWTFPGLGTTYKLAFSPLCWLLFCYGLEMVYSMMLWSYSPWQLCPQMQWLKQQQQQQKGTLTSTEFFVILVSVFFFFGKIQAHVWFETDMLY